MPIVERLDNILLDEQNGLNHSNSLPTKRQRPSSLPHWVLTLRNLSPATKLRITIGAILAGIPAIVYYYAWWLEPGHLGHALFTPILLGSVIYSSVQIFSAWYIYARIKLPPPRTAPPGMNVDVFIPVYDEEFALVEESLKAATEITYPHRTFLLDDARREDFRKLAERLDVIYLRRTHNGQAKAGNVNHGLQHSTADFVTVFDVDHIPEPHFLDTVLGYFDDPAVGFVQSFVAYGNQDESFIARATAGQSYDVFSATSMGMYGCGAATVWGAHCTFRRAALDSIGGHQVGLAEDLHTSLALHAKGWKSVYVPQLVARGLVPADLRAYFIQHLKWSHGVFEILFRKSPPLLRRLRPSQMLCYLTRMTYYFVGPVTFCQMLMLIGLLFFAGSFIQNQLGSFLVHLTPSMLTIMAIRVLISILWERDPTARLMNLESGALAAGAWPIYMFSLANVLLGRRLPHIATPKKAQGGHYLWLVMPQIVMVALLVVGIIRRLAITQVWEGNLLVIIAFALMMISWHGAVFYGVWEGWKLKRQRSKYQPAQASLS